MKSKRVQYVVLAVALVALAGWVVRSTAQRSSPSEEAARLVRGVELDEDSPIEETSTVERESPSQGAAQSASRLDGADATIEEDPTESADLDEQKRKTRKGRQKRSGGRKNAAESDHDEAPAAATTNPKVRISGNRVKKGGP